MTQVIPAITVTQRRLCVIVFVAAAVGNIVLFKEEQTFAVVRTITILPDVKWLNFCRLRGINDIGCEMLELMCEMLIWPYLTSLHTIVLSFTPPYPLSHTLPDSHTICTQYPC